MDWRISIMLPQQNEPVRQEDNRRPFKKLLKCFDSILTPHDGREVWYKEWSMCPSTKYPKLNLQFPLVCYKTDLAGPALHIITGVHGEEPAGPNALANVISVIGELGKLFPIVVIPMPNPIGYFMHQRYPNDDTGDDEKTGNGTAPNDCGYILPLHTNGGAGRRKPAYPCFEAKWLAETCLGAFKTHPPRALFDLHEDDEEQNGAYLYTQGALEQEDPWPAFILGLFGVYGLEIRKSGKTRWGEKVKNGIVSGIKDGTIDEVYSSEFLVGGDGELVEGPKCPTVIVLEQPTQLETLKTRIEVYEMFLTTMIKIYGETYMEVFK